MSAYSQKNKTFWILQTGEPVHTDIGNPRPMRAMNLANSLTARGHNVVLWTSAFYHQEKRHRTKRLETIVVSDLLTIKMIPSPGYSRNIGPGRLWDHAIMAKNLSDLLKSERGAPDAAFIGYPPIETAAVMASWLKKNNVNYLIDVKDQWPNLFVEALPSLLRPIGKVAFFPYFFLARNCMKSAAGLVGMSKGFLQWATKFAGRAISASDVIAPLTTPKGAIQAIESEEAEIWWDNLGVYTGIPRLSFVGSHSRAFDMQTVIESARSMSEKNVECQFVICGDGPLSETWKKAATGLNNIIFPGWIDRAKGEALSRRSTAAIAPYVNVDNFIHNMPNKIVDSLAQGLPILSPLLGEVRSLIQNNNVGLSYGPDSGRTLDECFNILINDNELRNELSKNAVSVYESGFTYEIVYGRLANHLENLSTQ